jgi:hypothetical protein
MPCNGPLAPARRARYLGETPAHEDVVSEDDVDESSEGVRHS